MLALTRQYEGHVGAENQVATAGGHLPLHIHHHVLPPGSNRWPCSSECAGMAVRSWAWQLCGAEGENA
jgi:hypothetical protein